MKGDDFCLVNEYHKLFVIQGQVSVDISISSSFKHRVTEGYARLVASGVEGDLRVQSRMTQMRKIMPLNNLFLREILRFKPLPLTYNSHSKERH